MSIKGDVIEKDFFGILYAMKDLNLEKWKVFNEFIVDHRTYHGLHYIHDTLMVPNSVKLASMYCSVNNFKVCYRVNNLISLESVD